MGLLLSSLLAAALVTSRAYAADDLWYPGEGVKQDMYVTYRIQELDANDGRPYEMTIYFKEQSNGDWIVPTYVVSQGKVIKGTMKLADNMAYLSGGSDVPAEMRTFISGYSGSLHWLDAFTTKGEPLSLTQGSWGKIAAIGGEEIKPRGPAKITVTAGTFDTTLVSWHKGVDNNIWILNEFPFPIMGKAFAEDATGGSVSQFDYELLATGTGEPTPPGDTEEIPTPPLPIRKTARGIYGADLDWEPAQILPGQEVSFRFAFYDAQGFPLFGELVNYDFDVKARDGSVLYHVENKNAEDGTGREVVKFNATGPATISITINSVSGRDTGQFTEAVDFNIVVVPEFPVGAAVAVGSVVGLIVVATRTRAFRNLLGGNNGL